MRAQCAQRCRADRNRKAHPAESTDQRASSCPAESLRTRPRAGTIDANALCIWAKMSASGQAIATVSTGDVSLAYHEITRSEAFNVIAHRIDNAHKFVTNYHRHGNRLLCPLVPVVDVHVRPADRSLQHTNQHVVAANFWNGNVLEPQTRLGSRLYHGLHHFLHNGKLCQSAKQERIFATARVCVTLTSMRPIGRWFCPSTPNGASPVIKKNNICS